MKARIETVSAITLKVAQMEESLRFYQGVLGLEIGLTAASVPKAMTGVLTPRVSRGHS